MKKNLYCYFIIFLFAFSYFFFLNEGSYFIGDDTIFHTSNILVMSKTINIFNFVPGKIMPILVNNLGYGVNLFYPIFPHLVGAYLVKIFEVFNLGIDFVMKFMHFIVISLSGILMYKYVFTAFKNRCQALVSAIIYQSMPYLFTDIFMRCALNESFLFIYLPIIFLSLYYLFEEDDKIKFYLYFVIGYSLLIYSHLVLAVYLTIFIIGFMFVYYKKLFSKKIISKLIIASILILLITSNFWAPLLEHKLLDNYFILNYSYNTMKDVEIAKAGYYFFPLKLFSTNPERFLLFYISPISLILMFGLYFLGYRKKIKKEHGKILLGMGIFFCLSLVVATSSFVWKFVPNILKNIQFAWRLALFIAFSASVLAGYGFRLFNNKWRKIVLIITIICCFVGNCYLTSYVTYKISDDIKFLDDSCCHIQWSYEYLPNISIPNSLQLYNKTIDLNNRYIKVIKNEVPNMEFEVFDLKGSINVEFPRIYYLGYKLVNDKGEKIILYQNRNGLLSTEIKGNGIYYLKYEGTIIDKITRLLSSVTMILSIVYMVAVKFVKRKEDN